MLQHNTERFFNNCQKYTANPLTPMSDQNRVSPYNTNNINQISDENKEKYQFGDN